VSRGPLPLHALQVVPLSRAAEILTAQTRYRALRSEGVWGSGCIDPLVGAEWSASRPRVKSPLYPLDRTLGGPQKRSGRCAEEKNVLPLPGIKPTFLITISRSPITMLTELYPSFALAQPGHDICDSAKAMTLLESQAFQCSDWTQCDKGMQHCFRAVVFNLSCSRTPRYNLFSTLYPQSCW
jgi:hypothetical protein